MSRLLEILFSFILGIFIIAFIIILGICIAGKMLGVI